MSKQWFDFDNLVEQDGLYYVRRSSRRKFLIKDNFYVPFTGEVTGTVTEYGVGEHCQYFGNMKDGKWEGEHLTYSKNRQLKEKRNWKDGKEEGEWLWYEKNGQLREKSIYKEGNFIKSIKL